MKQARKFCPFMRTLLEKDFEFGEYSILLKKVKNEIVTKSIDDYLQNHLNFDFDSFEKKLNESQGDKIYMLWNDSKFSKSEITELKIIKSLTVKPNGSKGVNTIIINSSSGKEFHFLLRWKNHRGVLYPAWQISIKK
jgi:hypothetical protein